MPLDPAIPLSVQTPQPAAPLATIGQLMQARGQLSELALNQARIEQARQQAADYQAAAAQKNRDLADQNTLADALRDPATAKQVYGGDFSPIDTLGLQPKSVDAFKSAVNQQISNKAALSATQLKNEQEAHGEIGKALAALQAMRNPDGSLNTDQVNSALPGVVTSLGDQFRILGLDASKMPMAIQNEDDLTGLTARAGAVSAMTDAALARKKTQTETAKAQAETAEAQQRGAEAAAAARKIGLEADLMADPGKGLGAIDVILGPGSTLAAGLKAEYNAAPTPEARAAVLSKASSLMGEKDPGMQAARAQQALLTAKATLPVEQARAQYQNALQQGDKATADYASTIGDARQTVSTAQTIHRVIDLAQQDNPTAGQSLKALVPEFTNAIQDIKRLGGAQATQITSTLEHAKGEIESGAGYSPTTAKALADIRPYIDTIANGAVNRANAQIDATNTAYGKTFAHEPTPVQYRQNAKTKQVIVSRDGGQTWADSTTGKPVR